MLLGGQYICCKKDLLSLICVISTFVFFCLLQLSTYLLYVALT